MMTQGIYCYMDKKTNKIVYIGKDSHINEERRHKQHILKSNYNRQVINRVVQNNPIRYEYKVLEEGNISQKILNALEMSFIRKHGPKFNFTKGGEGLFGHRFSKKHREKISQANKGRKMSDEQRKKISENNIKRFQNKENHPMFGKHHSEEAKKKISEKNKGNEVPSERRLRISQKLKGRKMSEKQKKVLSKKKNIVGIYNVCKIYREDYKQGFFYLYYYYENGKRKSLKSVDLKKLEKRVLERGLPWIKID